MNKADLINELHNTTSESKTDIGKILDAQAVIITEFLAEAMEGDSVTLPGIGKLTVARRKARTARNPKTGAEIQVPEKLVVQFRTVKALKDAANGG